MSHDIDDHADDDGAEHLNHGPRPRPKPDAEDSGVERLNHGRRR